MKVLATEQWPLCTLIMPLNKWMHAFTGGYRLLLLLNFVISESNKCCFQLNENGSLCFTQPHPSVAMTWFNALQYCKNLGTTLPILHNDDYSTIYKNALLNYGLRLGTFWLGAYSTYDQNNWYWTNGTRFTGTIENSTLPGKTHAYLKRIGNNVKFVAASPLEEHYRICKTNSYYSEEACTRSRNPWTNRTCYIKHSHPYYDYYCFCGQTFLVSYDDLKVASREFRDPTHVWIGLSCSWWTWHDIVTGRSYEIIRLKTDRKFSTGVYAQCLSSYKEYSSVVWYNDDCDRKFRFICQHHVNDTDGNITTPTMKSYGNCVVNSSTQRVNNDKFCDNETDTKYSIHWNRTIAGTNSSEPCPWNPTGWCSRECLPNTIWSQPTCNSCADKKFNDFFVRVNTLNLTALDNQNVTAKIASDLSTATNNSEGLTPGNLKASVELIKLLSDAIQRNDSNATINEMEIKSIVKAASNVLRPNNSESWETLKKENQNIATSILLSLDNYGRSLAALNISENRKEEENLILEAWSFEKSNLREIEFPSRSLWDEDRGDGISISVEALQSRMLSGRPTLNMWGSYYRTVNEYLPGHKDTDVVNSRVLSFSIDGLQNNGRLERPVLITLRHNQENRTGFQRKCAFWNFGSGTWDFDGCSVTLTNRTHTICSCNHLTNFAILMSLTPKEEDKLLSLISVIGCSISAAALILTILIYALTWKQSKSAQATVLLNLCVALASAYLIFLAGADKFGEERYQDGCTAVAVLLHYFFLAAFFIMLIEGVELVLYIIFVFHVRRTRETIMLIVSAWVLPLIIVGVSLGSTLSEGYGHKNACWLSAEKGLIWAFIGPVLFIVTANFVILIVVLSWMSQKKALLAKNGKKRDEIRATIWNLSVTCPVLGLGWLFGVLSLISDHVGFQYLFVIVNSLQGLLIFIFHALFHNKKMNEKISSFYSNYICRCRKSKLSVSTQITSAQEQSTSTTAASKATIEMTSAQEQSTSTTAASKATTEMTSAQEQSTSSILALTSTTEISSAQEQSTSSTPALTTTTEMTLAQDQATSSTSVTKVSTEMSSAQEQSTSSTRASASTAEVTSSQEQSTSSTSTSKVTTEMSSDQEQSTSSTSAKDSSAANKKPTDKAKVVPRAVKYYEDLIGRAGQFAQRCSAAYDQWRL